MKRLWLKTGAVIQGHVRLGEFNLLWAFQPDDPASLAGLPLINQLAQEYVPQGLHILGLSTAFEHFGGDAEAQTHELLTAPESAALFPVVMDYLHQSGADIPESYLSFLCERIPAFDSWPLSEQEALRLKARRYLSSKEAWAVTLTLNEFARTPVLVLFNRYYEILEAWAGTPDPEEVHARIAYWLSHIKSEDLNVDPY
ncbi:MAG: hypothetical protein ACAI44_36490 [Candidatus Sericytochromatia bacterium]